MTARKKSDGLRVLWEAQLKAGQQKDSFLFRATEDFETAARLAEELLESSVGAKLAGAAIVGIQRKARLWN